MATAIHGQRSITAYSSARDRSACTLSLHSVVSQCEWARRGHQVQSASPAIDIALTISCRFLGAFRSLILIGLMISRFS